MMSRMNAGLTGHLAFDTDTSAAYEPIQPPASSQDFSGEPPEKFSHKGLVPAKTPNSMDVKIGETHAIVQYLLWCPAVWGNSSRAKYHVERHMPKCILEGWINAFG